MNPQNWFNSPMFQAVLAALGRGLVLAAGAYFGMLIKHVTDTNLIIGTVGLAFIFPIAGLLHLVVPSAPGVATMAARWPRIGLPPTVEPPTTIAETDVPSDRPAVRTVPRSTK